MAWRPLPALANSASSAITVFSWLPAWNCRRHVAILRALTHKVIHQNDRQHRLSDRYGADADARIVTPLVIISTSSPAVNRMTGNGNTGGRLQRDVGNDLLAAADTAKNAAGVVALEPGFGDFIAVSLPRSFTTSKPSPISPFHGVDAHQRVGDIGIRAVEDRLAEAGGTPSATTVTFAPMESPSFQAAHQFIQASILSGSGQKKGSAQPDPSL